MILDTPIDSKNGRIPEILPEIDKLVENSRCALHERTTHVYIRELLGCIHGVHDASNACNILCNLRPASHAHALHSITPHIVDLKPSFYTIIVPMPRISACIPWHRHGYRPEVDIRAYATGYRQISVALGTILISVASGPEDIGRYPWHMPRDRCAQPFPFPHCILEPCTTQQLRTPTILESFVDRRPSWSSTQCALYRCKNVMPICM